MMIKVDCMVIANSRVALRLKRIVTLRKDKDDDVDVIKYKY